MSESEILAFLDAHEIAYRRYEHAAVFTVAQADEITAGLPGAGTKNLLLVEPAGGRCLLLMVPGAKRVNFQRLAPLVGAAKGLRFAPPELLADVLGVGPGAVTVLGLVNDTAQRAELWIDRALWAAGEVHCHPLVNTATLVMRTGEVERFFALTGHAPRFLDVPAAA